MRENIAMGPAKNDLPHDGTTLRKAIRETSQKAPTKVRIKPPVLPAFILHSTHTIPPKLPKVIVVPLPAAGAVCT